MTDKKDCMTMEQAEQKMECLREVFSIVRLVDGEMLEKRAEHSPDADAMEMCQCYSFWNKAKPCENCISMKSLREKKQAAKLEFLDSDIFQVFSRYVEIDGKPYVMEMLRKLDEDTLIDAVGYGKMVQKLSVYNDKLYRDALTGAYNRRYYEDEFASQIDKLYTSEDFNCIMDIVNHNIDILEKSFISNPLTMHREIETVKEYIHNHYSEELGAQQLADMVYLAPSYLSSLFKKETGQNLSKYIKQYRMEKAKELLTDTNMKIVNISEKTGYPNVSYFCQSFREYFGVSPQKFRDKGEVL